MNMELRTEISAKFITITPGTPEEQASLAALNMHTEAITQSLQGVFKTLIIEMLELKRQNFTETTINIEQTEEKK
ncbi:MAG: hypothetical protein DRH26_03605 [Deltaproteobacteria bacterium]|nr:MAG: hypothetical protein DRH26_03605 [Deltaproteobacteria bacterium]